MNLDQRAALVRAARLEIKENMITYELRRRHRERQERIERVKRRVGAEVDRIGAGINRRVEAVSAEMRRRQNAELRRTNMAQAERIRTEGYNISPEFRQRSARAAMIAQRQASRGAAGTGINRYRGAIADIRRDANARRPDPAASSNTPLINQRPGDATFPTPRRTVEATVIYRDRDRTRTQRTRTDLQRR